MRPSLRARRSAPVTGMLPLAVRVLGPLMRRTTRVGLAALVGEALSLRRSTTACTSFAPTTGDGDTPIDHVARRVVAESHGGVSAR
jgi:hypothetical protein